MDKIIKCLYWPEQQLIYDKLLADSGFTPFGEGIKTYGFTYTNNKRQYNIWARDFYEKGFNFFHEGKFYRYSCTVANSRDHKKLPKSTVRGETIYNLAIMERD